MVNQLFILSFIFLLLDVVNLSAKDLTASGEDRIEYNVKYYMGTDGKLQFFLKNSIPYLAKKDISTVSAVDFSKKVSLLENQKCIISYLEEMSKISNFNEAYFNGNLKSVLFDYLTPKQDKDDQLNLSEDSSILTISIVGADNKCIKAKNFASKFSQLRTEALMKTAFSKLNKSEADANTKRILEITEAGYQPNKFSDSGVLFKSHNDQPSSDIKNRYLQLYNSSK